MVRFLLTLLFVASFAFFFLAVLILIPGCSTISISTPDGYSASYVRMGSQDISGLTYSRDGNATLIGLDRQHSDAQTLDVMRTLLGVQQ